MPQPLIFLLLPTESISPQLIPVLASTLNRVTIFRTLDPEHGEPFVSGSLLLLSQSVPPSALLTRWKIQSPLGYNVHLSGLGPFPDFWIPLKTARQIAKDLDLLRDLGNLLDWNTRRMSSWFEGIGPDGVGVMGHNWKLPTESIGAEIYSHEMMTRTTFDSNVVFLADHQPLRTYLSASTIANLRTTSTTSLLPSNILPIWHSLILLTSQTFESFLDDCELISSGEDQGSIAASEWSGAVAVVWLSRVLSPFTGKGELGGVERGDVEIVVGDLLRGLRSKKKKSKAKGRESKLNQVKIEEETKECGDLEDSNEAEDQGTQDGMDAEEREERRKDKERTSVRWKVASQIIETLGLIVSGWVGYELFANDLIPDSRPRSYPPSSSSSRALVSPSSEHHSNLDKLEALVKQSEKKLIIRLDEQSLTINTLQSHLHSSSLRPTDAASDPHHHHAQKERREQDERETKLQLTIFALMCSNIFLAGSVCYLLHLSFSLGDLVQQEEQCKLSEGAIKSERRQQRDDQRGSTVTIVWALIRWIWRRIITL